MITIKYIVKARDNHGQEYIHTYNHPASQEQLASGPQEGVEFMQDIVSTYESEVMRAAPFRCAVCSLAARKLFHVPTAHLQSADPAIFDVPMPYCGSSSCEKMCLMRAQL